ncbi:b3 domain-containing protein rem16 [Quercus suber]|uniref:B3 domain-containing protein rem16 n=1 Tax=Quercus suber TaxID=58331 RepID=A0AAW0JG32_QUESU
MDQSDDTLNDGNGIIGFVKEKKNFLFLQHFTPLLHLCPQLSSLLMFVLTLQVIPKTFSNNLRKKLPQSATLKGPSGLTWDVELTTNDDATFFNHSWQKFVKDHSLEETNLLNLCGKGASYFVKKCGQTEHDNRCLTKKRLKEGSMDDPIGC